jgi:hypothetical protein
LELISHHHVPWMLNMKLQYFSIWSDASLLSSCFSYLEKQCFLCVTTYWKCVIFFVILQVFTAKSISWVSDEILDLKLLVYLFWDKVSLCSPG